VNPKRKSAGFAELSASPKVHPHFKSREESKVRATNDKADRQGIKVGEEYKV